MFQGAEKGCIGNKSVNNQVSKSIITDTKKFQETLKPLFSNKSKTANTIILHENLIVKDNKISHTLNKYFTNLIKTLKLKQTSLKKKSLKSLLRHFKKPLNFAKFVSTRFLIKHLRWLLLNDFVKIGNFPYILKSTNITPVFKNGDTTDKTKFRPISTLCNILKRFRKLIYAQIN